MLNKTETREQLGNHYLYFISPHKIHVYSGEEMSSVSAYFTLVSSLDTQLFRKLSVSDMQNVFPIRQSPPFDACPICLNSLHTPD